MLDDFNQSEPPAWPEGTNLLAGQAGRTHDEWIDDLDPLIYTLAGHPEIDDASVDRLRAIRDWHLDQL